MSRHTPIRYVALRDDDEHTDLYDITNSLDKIGITYELYSYDDSWSVIAINGIKPLHSGQKSFENAIGYVNAEGEE